MSTSVRAVIRQRRRSAIRFRVSSSKFQVSGVCPSFIIHHSAFIIGVLHHSSLIPHPGRRRRSYVACYDVDAQIFGVTEVLLTSSSKGKHGMTIAAANSASVNGGRVGWFRAGVRQAAAAIAASLAALLLAGVCAA